MSDRDSIETALLSSILQDEKRVLDLCDEFGITAQTFHNKKMGLLYSLIKMGHPYSKYEYLVDDIRDFVPTSDNARYYIEELTSLIS